MEMVAVVKVMLLLMAVMELLREHLRPMPAYLDHFSARGLNSHFGFSHFQPFAFSFQFTKKKRAGII
jgi:hypothetical protein